MDVTVNGGLRDTRNLYRTDSLKTISSTSVGPGGQIVVSDPSTLVRVGDTFRAETGPLAGQEIPVIAQDQNSFTLASKVAPAVGNTYYTLRPVTSRVNSDGTQSVTTSQGPTQFTKNGVDVTVNQDTTTPANSRGLPVVQLNTLGAQFDGATAARQDTGNTSLGSIDTKLPSQVGGKVPVDATGSTVGINNFPATQNVNVTGSVLPTGAATSALQTQISSQLPTTVGQKPMAQSLAVALSSDQSAIPAYAPDQIASATISAVNTNLNSGTATANSTVTITGIQGMAVGIYQVPTTATLTLIGQMTLDGSTWVNCPSVNVQNGNISTSNAITAGGLWMFNAPGATAIRVTASAYTSGAPTVYLKSCARPSFVNVEALPAGTNSIGNIGTVATVTAVTSITNPVTAAQATAAAKTVKSAQITVGTTAVRATTDNLAVTAGRVVLKVKPSPNNTGSIYIGASTVTTTTGMLVLPAETMELSFDAGDYYLIADTAGQTAFILEQE